ncbi:butyryl-CoA dehydrogenase [Algibacter lectus]|uniref:Butyryl-CoA dehydrogenase n=1 Tax=Algibacter lectus TaxID=221126 RepID=A0A090WXH9_9FLAO|nr:butyryl-CoA dehydrogenase [Algibacter lectus]
MQKEVVPHIEKWEQTGGLIDRFIWKKIGDMGFFGIKYPEAYGGLDLDLFYTVILLEELQKINSGGFAAAIWAHTYLAMTHLNAEGDEAIKQKYLVPSITGDKIGCLCISEPFGGSDVAGMRTTAVKKGDKYIINGSKTFITNGVLSDYLVVAAKTSPELGNKGISIFVVDRETKGLSATKLNKLGWRASDTGEIAFDNVEIPANQILGEADKGFAYIMQHFALERLIMGGINGHARAEFALEYALKYMSERQAFGRTIDKFQALRHTIADLYTDMEMCKTFNYAVAYRLNKGGIRSERSYHV